MPTAKSGSYPDIKKELKKSNASSKSKQDTSNDAVMILVGTHSKIFQPIGTI
jgi:hypothetical protein